MVLGLANFSNNYNGVNIKEDECYKLLEYFEKNGGKLVDTACDYGNSEETIFKYNKFHNGNLQVVTKIKENLQESLLRNYSNLYGVLFRGGKIKNFSHINNIKYGQSIYYPHEISQKAKIIQIPASKIFIPYLEIMSIHAEVYVRSIFRLNVNIDEWLSFKKQGLIKDFVLGVENIKHLEENMEVFL